MVIPRFGEFEGFAADALGRVLDPVIRHPAVAGVTQAARERRFGRRQTVDGVFRTEGQILTMTPRMESPLKTVDELNGDEMRLLPSTPGEEQTEKHRQRARVLKPHIGA